MYKYILIIIFVFALALETGAQSMPESFGLGKFGKYNAKPVKTQRDNINAMVVNPLGTKCPISNFFTDIIRSGDTVWFATGTGIMRTINNFNSFEYYNGLEPFGNDDIPGMFVKNNVVVVSTATSEDFGGEMVSVGTGVKVSTDYGKSWSAYPQPMDGQSDSVIVYGSNSLYALPVVVPQQNLSYGVCVTRTKNDLNNYTIWVASFAGGLRKSTNYGSSFQRVLLPPDDLDSIYPGGTYTFALNPRNNLNHRVFSVIALNDSTILAGSADGINVSYDWGVSWRKYNFQNSGSGTSRVSGNFVVNFHIQRYNNKQVIWAATRRAEDNNEENALSYSTNRGQTWNYTLSGYSPNGIFSKDSVVYGLTDAGLWRATYGIFDWAKPSIIADPVTKDVCKSTNFYAGASISDTLYIGGNDGLLRTMETGIPWASPWKIYRACGTINEDSKSFAAPNPFSPAYEVTRIFYKTGKTSAKITIKIFDFGMNSVRTVIQNAVRTSTEELFTIWDGKNNDGYIVANGVYFYRIEIDDDDAQWGKIILMQ